MPCSQTSSCNAWGSADAMAEQTSLSIILPSPLLIFAASPVWIDSGYLGFISAKPFHVKVILQMLKQLSFNDKVTPLLAHLTISLFYRVESNSVNISSHYLPLQKTLLSNTHLQLKNFSLQKKRSKTEPATILRMLSSYRVWKIASRKSLRFFIPTSLILFFFLSSTGLPGHEASKNRNLHFFSPPHSWSHLYI